ncbi:HDOD domain-containing protein [Vibrio cincinnatiensis]|uniref:HD-like signal output (HDOD) domain, no enzymatic activity n=1 Tax=Vibrio cincinnatiensis DSM 19608 TaxID=1123491 RepID=A0A1T4KBJ3_VIBCI|nr:HDOD domain-containing protein [Vibrio cincinnatiensis]MCG3721901.1 HDOD domain-containing protein [Vibrio cincinnatiensis]MCG3724336.1 HDOD domain-containing protein [Vibrio cincinnatiensis]MCG3731285.1 HDOD domain-containing protein [Vibrio cincinnatiensis]MCG3734994.1 HDOD domain-containing protein [Vibrio cincinnatiensis]MCG3738798.1 HDOD domain-containing protein [Vibrio cincinnatiensis]
MNHLSFYWLPENKQQLIQGLKSEFAQLVESSISNGQISLPPIPDVVIKIQTMSRSESTTIIDIATCLTDDPSLAAVVIRIANSVVFNRRNITCTDLVTAVSRLGINRVRDIVTAQAIEQLKHSVNLSAQCNKMLTHSAHIARELGATMVLVTQLFKRIEPEYYSYLEQEKALLVGLLADIGLFCLVNEYHLYLEKGHYLDSEIALQIFHSNCPTTSKLVLKHWGFDNDFLEVACNQQLVDHCQEVSYLDVARIAHHLLMFRKQDDALDEHDVEINATGAEVLYHLSNLDDKEFRSQLKAVINASGF